MIFNIMHIHIVLVKSILSDKGNWDDLKVRRKIIYVIRFLGF